MLPVVSLRIYVCTSTSTFVLIIPMLNLSDRQLSDILASSLVQNFHFFTNSPQHFLRYQKKQCISLFVRNPNNCSLTPRPTFFEGSLIKILLTGMKLGHLV